MCQPTRSAGAMLKTAGRPLPGLRIAAGWSEERGTMAP